MKITLKDIEKAHANIAPIIKKTEIDKSNTLSNLCNAPIYFKTENLQKTGSFKLRGSANKIYYLKEKGEVNGVVAASAGNHAQGVAYAATKYGIPSTIVMPEGAPIIKVTATKGYGAEVILKGETYDQCYNVAIEVAKEKGATYVHAFDDPDVIAGQGTIGLEILEQLPTVKNIIVPMGGGGLAAGILLAVKEKNPDVRIIGVQSELAPNICKKVLCSDTLPLTSKSIADGISVEYPGDLTTAIIKEYIDDVVLVNEDEISRAILFMLERCKMIVEGAGATTVAALMYNKIENLEGETVAVLSGGNIDINIISSIIQRGLVKANRTAFLDVEIKDKPGQLNEILKLVAEKQANVINVHHDRLAPHLPFSYANVNLCLETQNGIHLQDIIDTLKSKGFKVNCKNQIDLG